jgi:hypothetical protein
MSNLSRFMTYAAAFERTFADDDWARLAPFFTEDAVYEVTGIPKPCELHGRDAIFAGMRKSLDGFDRKMDRREISSLEPPSEQGSRVMFTGVVRYQRGAAPPVELRATITADFEGDRICHMRDAFALDAPALGWLAKHGADLDGSYT